MVFYLILALIIALIILFIIWMKKSNYDLNGMELVMFWLTFPWIIFLIYDTGYGYASKYDIYIYIYMFLVISIIFFVVSIICLVIYYLINAIKHKKYIKWQLIVTQAIISMTVHIVGVHFFDGYLMFFIFLILFGIVSYMLTINFIILIIKLITKK